MVHEEEIEISNTPRRSPSNTPPSPSGVERTDSIHSPAPHHIGRSGNKGRDRSPTIVDVYISGQLVGDIRLRLLKEFSCTARLAFPGSTALDGAAEQQVRGPNVAALITRFNKMAGGIQQDPQNRVRLELEWEPLTVQPSTDAVGLALAWMREAARTPPNETAPQLGVAFLNEHTLQQAVDLLAAAVVLELQPYPKDLQHDICARLKGVPPRLEDIQIVHERLPLHSAALTVCIHAYMRRSGSRHSPYTDDEIKSIQAYIAARPALFTLWNSTIAQRQSDLRRKTYLRQLRHVRPSEGGKGNGEATEVVDSPLTSNVPGEVVEP